MEGYEGGFGGPGLEAALIISGHIPLVRTVTQPHLEQEGRAVWCCAQEEETQTLVIPSSLNQAVRTEEGPSQVVVVTILAPSPKGCVQGFSRSRCLRSKIYSHTNSLK